MQNLGFLDKLFRQTSVRTSGFQWLITQIEMQADKQKFCKRQKAFIGKDGYLQTNYCFNEQLRTTQLLLLSTRSFIPGYFPFWKQETKPSETSYCEMMLNNIGKPCDTKKNCQVQRFKKGLLPQTCNGNRHVRKADRVAALHFRRARGKYRQM